MKPYLSIVVAARNDNYGGDFLRRMQLFLSTLAALSDRHRLKAELLIVEWNPPADRPRLGNVIDWPSKGCDLDIRIVEVPEEIHRRFPNSDRMPMFEYTAKNVGIRRARGEFILPTNPDIIFSDELIAFLAQGNVPTESYLKVDRYDIAESPPLRASVDKTLRFCRHNVVRIWKWDGFPVDTPLDPSFLRKVRNGVRSFASRPTPARLAKWMWRRIKSSNNGSSPKAPELKPEKLHLATPGDFILMSGRQWHDLRGFPELPSHSHLDTCLVYLAAATGLKLLALPHRIYHIEHGRAEHALRPVTDSETLQAFREMLASNRPVITNGDSWGLGDVVLPEYEISTFDRVLRGGPSRIKLGWPFRKAKGAGRAT